MYMYLPVSRTLLCREINISMNLASVDNTPVLCLSFLPYIYGPLWAHLDFIMP